MIKRPYITFDSTENYSISNLAGIFYYRDRIALMRVEIFGAKCSGRVGVLGELFGITLVLTPSLHLTYSGGRFKGRAFRIRKGLGKAEEIHLSGAR